MRLLQLAVALALAAPVALASHAVNHDPLGFRDPNGPLFQQTCRAVVFDDVEPLPPVPVQPVCDGANGLAEVAADGYVLAIERTGSTTFTVKVRHALTLPVEGGNLPVAAQVVPLAPVARSCATAVECDYNGLWVHSLDDDGNPISGAYPAQTIAPLSEDSWLITITSAPPSPPYVSLVGVVTLAGEDGQPGEWVRGFYNPAKLALPLDPLDAVPYPTLL